MFDRQARTRLEPLWQVLARPLHRLGARPDHLTAIGLVLAVAAAVAAGRAAWTLAAVLWLSSRVPDGVDGALARLRGDDAASDLGGFHDIVADFAAYGAFVVGCAVGQPEARVACLALLLSYYVNGATVLAYASVAERRRLRDDGDGRSLELSRGLAEGLETIVAHTVMALVPSHLATVAWVFTGMVSLTALQRVVQVRRRLSRPGRL